MKIINILTKPASLGMLLQYDVLYVSQCKGKKFLIFLRSFSLIGEGGPWHNAFELLTSVFEWHSKALATNRLTLLYNLFSRFINPLRRESRNPFLYCNVCLAQKEQGWREQSRWKSQLFKFHFDDPNYIYAKHRLISKRNL